MLFTGDRRPPRQKSMKPLTTYFQEFLTTEVRISPHQRHLLNQRTSAVSEFLSQNLSLYEKTERQGSYALNTLIKPVETREYDVDLLVFMTRDAGKKPREYINDVDACFQQHDAFPAKIRRKTRCICLDYADAFHVDVVPCITDGDTRFICNHDTDKFEPTDGIGYREWLSEKTRHTHGHLKPITQLLKFLRDHKNNFSIKSILLTTLMGEHVYAYDKVGDAFRDVPTSLKTISNRIHDFLQEHASMPDICNPALPAERFTRHWTAAQYRNLREKFGIYNEKINAAFDATEHNTGVRKWRELFGDAFGEEE